MSSPRTAVAGIAIAVSIGFVSSASAAIFEITTEGTNELKFYNNKNSLSMNEMSFFGSVGSNNNNDDVGVTTNTPVAIGNGYATIKPDSGFLTTLTFTPTLTN